MEETETLTAASESNIDYPIYFITGDGADVHLIADAEIENALTQLETVDVEICTSDEEVSLSDFDVVLEREARIDTDFNTGYPQLETVDVKMSNSDENVSLLDFDEVPERGEIKSNGQLQKEENESISGSGKKQKRYYVLSTGRWVTEEQIDEIIAQWKPLLKCELCLTARPNFTLLQEHFKIKHPRFTCHIVCCRGKMERRTNIEEHIRKYHCDGVPRDISVKGTPININTEEIASFIRHYIPKMRCRICTKDCESFELYRTHFVQQHPYEEFYYSCCKRKMTRLQSVAEHIRVHLYEDSYKCKYCDKFHFTRVELELHITEKHRSSTFKTSHHFNLIKSAKENPSVARTSFADLDDFFSKWRKLLDCPLCPMHFHNMTALEIHFSEKHPANRTFVWCCGHGIQIRHELEEHIHLHTNPLGFKCPTCPKYWRNRSDLYHHMTAQHPLSYSDDFCDPNAGGLWQPTAHVDELLRICKTKIICAECNEKVPNIARLKVHFANHHPQEHWYFSCCHLKLSSPLRIAHHMRLHLQNIRTEEQKRFDGIVASIKPILKCDVCCRYFPYFSELEKHFEIRHPSEECHIICCHRKLFHKPELEEHIRLHNEYKCKYCDFAPYTKLDIAQHMRKCHRRQWMDFCFKLSFSEISQE